MVIEEQNDQSAAVVVKDNEVVDRFELYVNGAPAGFLTYSIQDGNYALNHEEIDPAFQGRGLGAQLVTRALDQIRSTGHGVLPFCPFVLSFLQRHATYQDLVPARYREKFELSTT